MIAALERWIERHPTTAAGLVVVAMACAPTLERYWS